eukprot:g4125.t1
MVEMREHVDICKRTTTDLRQQDRCVVELQVRVNKESNEIIYGVKNANEKRAEYVEKYGCAAWTDEALDILLDHSPLIELGAGAGKWLQAFMTKHYPHGDMVGFDNNSSIAPPSASSSDDGHRRDPKHVSTVQFGDESELLNPAHTHRTLFLCYPPLLEDSRLALDALKRYKGDTLIYVGEGRGGVNGGESFFDRLELEWEVSKSVKLNPFPSNFERLFVLKRREKCLVPDKEKNQWESVEAFEAGVKKGYHVVTFYGQWCHFSRVFVGFDKDTNAFVQDDSCTFDKLVNEYPLVNFHVVHEPDNSWVRKKFAFPGYPITLCFRDGINIASIVGAQPLEECKRGIESAYDL